tara:strand:- start:1696 stop:1872 length:177 start_codon:yes stop_codon:yes gene_type:complete
MTTKQETKDELYGIVEKLLGVLMDLEYPFELNSDLICSINLFDECACPSCGNWRFYEN